ncbi:MAG: multidrug effflux MFS transporter [Rhodospirillales bacterium]|nr:multidrug effflux MFS transporter [Rhodospirillales bacterium]
MPNKPLSTLEFIILFSAIQALTAISIDAVLPALLNIGQEFKLTDSNDTQFVVSMFILGMVLGELIFGPLSDAIGRKKTILLGLLIYAVSTVVAMTAFSFEQILIARIVQGIGVAAPKTTSRALIRDQFEGEAMARIMSFIFMVFILAPMCAPAMGQLLVKMAGWRAIFSFYLLWTAVIAVWLVWRQPETLHPERRIPLSIRSLFWNTSLVVRHPRVMAYTLAAGLIFGALLIYLGTAQAMFLDLYDIADTFPMYFAVLAFAIGMAAFLNSQFVVRIGMHRLSVVALSGLVLFSFILLVTALIISDAPPFGFFMTSCFLMFLCVGCLFGNLNALAMQSLGRVAGLGASLVAAISSLVAVALAVPVGRLYNQTVIPFASGFMIAGILAIALLALAKRSHATPI